MSTKNEPLFRAIIKVLETEADQSRAEEKMRSILMAWLSGKRLLKTYLSWRAKLTGQPASVTVVGGSGEHWIKVGLPAI